MTNKPVTYLYTPHQLGVESDISRQTYDSSELEPLVKKIAGAIIDLLVKDGQISHTDYMDWKYDIDSQLFVVILTSGAPRD